LTQKPSVADEKEKKSLLEGIAKVLKETEKEEKV
jgi:hypothetical protein